jgi:hypothetical protein
VLSFGPANLIGSNKARAEVRLAVQLDVVDHSVVERIPKVALSSRNVAGHTEMIYEPGKVGLSFS